MWNECIRQLLTLIHKERVATVSIYKDEATLTVPSLTEDYKEASYAFREPPFLEEFLEIAVQTIPNFINKHDKISDILENLSQYYYDYPLDPADNIQLLRFFTALEQCADRAQKEEELLSKRLTDEEKARKTEFDQLLKHLAKDASQFPKAYPYLRRRLEVFCLRRQ